jgi:AcrR family transcriptional regulator
MATLPFGRIAAVSSEDGLRERKKRQTRQGIAEAAWRLFVEHGFDQVTVAEVARAADVSEATVFNYFPTKEDLAYHRMEDFEEEMLAAIRDREPGSPIIEAFGRFVLEPRGFLREGPEPAADRPEAVIRVFVESPALRAREREILDRYARRLAAVIAEERGAAPEDIEPLVIANGLVGLHRALLDLVRRRLLAGADPRRIAREVRVQGRRALGLLEHGLDAGAQR